EHQLVPPRIVVRPADALVRGRQLHRPTALDRHLPELSDAGDVGAERDKPPVRRERRPGGGADVQVAIEGKLGRHRDSSVRQYMIPATLLVTILPVAISWPL